jgi:hypothetical protein
MISTDLNHVGYGLDRESVPLCLHVNRSAAELERDCFMNETKPAPTIKKFRWADRDFNVDPSVIGDFVSTFLLNNNSICEDVRDRAEQKEFVVYNAYCRYGNDTRFHVEHYYRNSTS